MRKRGASNLRASASYQRPLGTPSLGSDDHLASLSEMPPRLRRLQDKNQQPRRNRSSRFFSPGGQKAPFRRLRRPIRPLGAELRFLRGPFGQRDVVLPVPLSQRPPVPDPCLSPEPSRTTSSLAVLLAAAAVRRPLLHPQKGLVGYDCGALRPGHGGRGRRGASRVSRRGLGLKYDPTRPRRGGQRAKKGRVSKGRPSGLRGSWKFSIFPRCSESVTRPWRGGAGRGGPLNLVIGSPAGADIPLDARSSPAPDRGAVLRPSRSGRAAGGRTSPSPSPPPTSGDEDTGPPAAIESKHRHPGAQVSPLASAARPLTPNQAAPRRKRRRGGLGPVTRKGQDRHPPAVILHSPPLSI